MCQVEYGEYGDGLHEATCVKLNMENMESSVLDMESVESSVKLNMENMESSVLDMESVESSVKLNMENMEMDCMKQRVSS